MSLMSTQAIHGKIGQVEYYLTTIKARRAVEILQDIQSQDHREKRTLFPEITRKITKDDPKSPFHQPILVGLIGGDPEFIQINVTGNFQISQETEFETPEFQIGVFRLTEPGEFFILNGEIKLESIRARIRESVSEGNGEEEEDDIPIMIVEHPDSRKTSKAPHQESNEKSNEEPLSHTALPSLDS